MKFNKTNRRMQTIAFLFLAAAMLAPLPGYAPAAAAEDGWTKLGADAWRNSDKWYVAGDAMLNPDNPRLLLGKAGKGVLINGKVGKCPSLVTKRGNFRDVELHVEFMMSKGSNSGVIFFGTYEIQILDSAHVKELTGAHCGGIYPRAERKPKYHHIDKGSPPSVNAAKKPGEWQTFDIIFQAARFDKAGKKTAHAKFVKVTHNGKVIQENKEVPYATGWDWDRKQYPRGPIIIQGDYGPVAIRNVRVRDWKAGDKRKLNVPPEGFTGLFNGKDLTGWNTPPKVREFWSIEDGVLKSPGLLKKWGAGLQTKKKYRDFVLMLDFRMPTISDSGISFRRLIPEIPGFGNMEQFNLRSKGGMGHLESYYFLPKETAKKHGLKEEEKPHVRHIDPKVGVWHTVKLTMKGRTFSAEYDGEVILDKFKYHDWMINMEPAPIRLQKHIVVHGQNLGKENPCPIEYRNIFIKELKASEPRAGDKKLNVPPEGFTALFNGRDFTGWRVHPKVRKMWSIENGVLKSHGLLEQWGADLQTVRKFKDFVLLADFRMPTSSDSGIHFRTLLPKMGNFGQTEQLNIGTGHRMGNLESLGYMLATMKDKAPIKRKDLPSIKRVDPKVGVWHTIKMTVIGQTITVALDGKVIIDRYEYPKGILGTQAAPIRFQKHRFLEGPGGKKNPCPIEYRNLFIKEIKPSK